MLALLLLPEALGQAPLTRGELDDILEFREHELTLQRVVNGRWRWDDQPTVEVAPPEIDDEWAVYRGGRRLTVPAYLEVVGEPDQARVLQERIERAAAVGDAFNALGWAGLLGGAAGTFLSATAGEPGPSRALLGAGAVSTLFGVTSLVIGGSERSRARGLMYEFEQTQPLPRVEERVEEHNERLREGLLAPAAPET
jgi:hypothetical protein